jgi:hypothetical protein
LEKTEKQRTLIRAARHLQSLRVEALRVYRPLPDQAPIHSSRAKRLVIRGGNRSGKTLNGAVRCALKVKEPPKAGEKGRGLIVSLDNSLLAKNCYAKLFEEGAFRVCSSCGKTQLDCDCGPTDATSFRKRSKPAPALIPDRLVDRFVWLEKGRKILDFVVLRTGWIIEFRSVESTRKKFQGEDWDWAWIDEEGGSDEGIMVEIERGLLENEGELWWTATPLAAGVKLFEYSENAREEEEIRADLGHVDKDPYYEEVILDSDDNPTLPAEALEKFYEGMSEDEERVRRKGEFLIQQGLVYGEWDKRVHLVDTYAIPADWTVYDFADPGCANAFATLFIAIKPDGDWVLFDEGYERQTDIPDIVKGWKAKLSGDSPGLGGVLHWSQRTGIDPASKQVHAGMKLNHVKSQLEQERRTQNLRSFEGDHGVYIAPNSRLGGILAVKSLLKVRTGLKGKQEVKNGTPQLTVMRHLIHWQREIRRYRWPRRKDDRDIVEAQGPTKKDDHLMDLIRYAALSNLSYVPPENRPSWGKPGRSPILNKIKKRRARRRAKAYRDALDCS